MTSTQPAVLGAARAQVPRRHVSRTPFLVKRMSRSWPPQSPSKPTLRRAACPIVATRPSRKPRVGLPDSCEERGRSERFAIGAGRPSRRRSTGSVMPDRRAEVNDRCYLPLPVMNDPLPLSELGGWDEPNPH